MKTADSTIEQLDDWAERKTLAPIIRKRNRRIRHYESRKALRQMLRS